MDLSKFYEVITDSEVNEEDIFKNTSKGDSYHSYILIFFF